MSSVGRWGGCSQDCCGRLVAFHWEGSLASRELSRDCEGQRMVSWETLSVYLVSGLW